MITTKDFWVGTAERGVKTFCQTFLAAAFLSVGADAIGTTAGVADIGWLDAASVAATATIFSVITSVGNANFTAGKQETLPAAPVSPRTIEDEDGRA